jgi:hypothetical protein
VSFALLLAAGAYLVDYWLTVRRLLLLMSDVLRRNELHVWFVAEHLVDIPVVRI